jgi:3',5'-cyclic AMP phosphodiesterase CpdA
MKHWGVILLAAVLLAPVELSAETIALVSDLNGRYGSTDYNRRVERAVGVISQLQPDLVLIAGDMVAGQKQPLLDSDRLAGMWSAFHATVSDPLRQSGIPVVVTPGNHDGSALPGFELEQEQFARQWTTRRPGLAFLPGSDWPTRYAAMLGDVLLIGFDGTWPGAVQETEKAFVGEALARHSGKARATVAFSHLPLWPFAKGRESQTLNDPEFLALLHRHGVDVYASGHHHVSWAGVDAAGMVHLSVGALGGGARSFSAGSSRQPHSFMLLSVEETRTRIETRMAPGFESPVGTTELPERIEGPLGVLERLDGPAPLRP